MFICNEKNEVRVNHLVEYEDLNEKPFHIIMIDMKKQKRYKTEYNINFMEN